MRLRRIGGSLRFPLDLDLTFYCCFCPMLRSLCTVMVFERALELTVFSMSAIPNQSCLLLAIFIPNLLNTSLLENLGLVAPGFWCTKA